MLFTKRTDFISPQTGIALGQTVRMELTREFHVEAIFVIVRVTNTAVMATANADAIQNILNQLTLTVNSGASTRNVVDVSGPGLLEYARQTSGSLDRQTDALIGTNPAAATHTLIYPVYCAHPQMPDPIKSSLLLPAPAYASNPILQLRFSTQAQMDTNAAPTFAVSDITAEVVIVRRFANIPRFPFFEWELTEQTKEYTVAGTNQRFELPIPGSYTGILLRDYTSASARGDISTGGLGGSGENKLQLLGVVLRRFKTQHLQLQNDISNIYSVGANKFTASYFLDFLHDTIGQGGGDLGSVLDGNIVVGSGARIEMLQDIAGAAGVQRKYVMHRIFGNLATLKRAA